MKKQLTSYSKILFSLLFASLFAFAKEDPYSELRVVFPQVDKVEKLKISDEVSAEKNNVELLVLYAKSKRIGFARKINTTTGCNSACLPIVYTAFFDKTGNYIKLVSPPGLTKIFHQPFSAEDYSKLDLLLAINPQVFKQVAYPKEMTDAISGETLKEYKESVVEGAAYSTLRINLYHQETIKHIQKYLQKN